METRIAELREAQGMKRTELATRAGVGVPDNVYMCHGTLIICTYVPRVPANDRYKSPIWTDLGRGFSIKYATV